MSGPIGKRTPLVDGRAKVTGEALYTDDLKLPGMLVGKVLRSPHAHARILSLDTSVAEAMEGVYAVADGRDTDARFGVLPITEDETAFAVEKVAFVGDQVAAVAACDEETALRALDAIVVEYEPLPAVLRMEHGLLPIAEGSEKINPRSKYEGNLFKTVELEFGDVTAAFAGAATVKSREFRMQGVTHTPTEPLVVVARWQADNRLTVWSATQVPHYLHRALAKVMEMPMHLIRVIRPFVGGAYGGKSDPFPHEMAAALLSRKAGRPVKILFDREEVFISNHGRHPTRTTMSLAVNADGSLAGLQTDALIDGGAWGSFGVITTYYNGVLSAGPYKIPSFKYRGRRVYSNKPASGAMRGHGAVNSRFAVETLLDEAAEELGLDPCDLRLQNAYPPNSMTPNGLRITSCGIVECITKVREASGWDSRRGNLPRGRGLGLGCGFYISGSALPIHWERMPQSTVHIKIDYDGGVTVHSLAAEIGQGSDTMLAQCVAETLGVSLARIRVYSGNTDTAPIDL
ncbi:molybdopterin-dependent oxidoreductase, partial [bacterium]|nr:molybdopterin-dependent oxidoreductase [bacterium]